MRKTILAVVLSFLALSAIAQTVPGELFFYRQTSSWLTTLNTAGLKKAMPKEITDIRAGFEKTNGSFTDVDASDNSWTAGADADGFHFLSDRMALREHISYSYFRGKNMGGPVMINPDYNFLNFTDRAEDDLGIKILETFSIGGALSYQISEKLSLGARMDYQTAEYAKRKDPRTDNKWMDLGLGAGAIYTIGRAALGFDLRYRRTVETLKAKIFGEAATQYQYIIDYGAFYGPLELFGETASMLSDATPKPMTNSFYGAALQAEFFKGSRAELFNEVSFLLRKGSFGKKSSAEILYADADGMSISYNGVLSLKADGCTHRIALDAEYSSISADRNNYQLSTTAGENTEVKYFGSYRTQDRSDISVGLHYLSNHFNAPLKYFVGADASFNNKNITCGSYPYSREQTVNVIDADFCFGVNFNHTGNTLTPYLALGYVTGSGTKASDSVQGDQTDSNLVSGTGYLNRNFEFLTSDAVKGTVALRLSNCSIKRANLYAEVSDTFVKALKTPEYLPGSTRNILSLTLGCSF